MLDITSTIASFNAGRDPERLAMKYKAMRASPFVFCAARAIDLTLDALSPYPNSQIVLTTAWAWWLGDAEVVALLPRALGKKVVASTREFPA
jgi:uncharacterized protein (DUF2252 family)